MNIYNIAKIRLNEMFNSALDFFTKKYQVSNKQFTLSSAWGQILQAQHEIARLNHYYIEDSITELNIETALRPDSIRGLSTLTGHVPFMGNAANGTIIIYRKPNVTNVTTSNIVIPNYTKIYSKYNGLEYTIMLNSDYILLNVNSSQTIDIRVVQGVVESQTVTGTGEGIQTFTINVESNYFIDHDEINVYVNDVKWNRVNSLLEMSYDSEDYYVKSGITGGLAIYFGNTLNGKIPSLGSQIKIEYIKHKGFQGNIINADPLFEIRETLYDTLNNEVEFKKIFGIGIRNNLMFGADAETTEMTKQLCNRVDRTNVLYTPKSFELFLKKYNMFSIVQAYKTIRDNILEDDNIVYILLVPDIKKRISKTINYFNIPLEQFKITDSEKSRILETIEHSGRKPSNIIVSIIDPKIKKYILNIKVIIFDSFNMQKESIKNNIREVIGNYFIYNERYNRIPKSDIIRIIEDIQGVDSVSVHFIGEDNENFKKNYQTTALKGLDEFNDIVVGNNEIPVLRGGWEDANGVFYSNDINDSVSMINISIINEK